MVKILFLIPTLMHGGAEKVLVNLVNNMDCNKFDITLQTIFDVGVNKQYLNKNIRYKTIFPKLFYGNTTLFKLFSPKFLYQTLIKEEYDIAVSYLEGSTARIISGCPHEKTKLVSWIHIEMDTPKMAAIGFRNLRECQEQYKKFDQVICVSEKVKETFIKAIEKIDIKKVSVLYNTNETKEIIKKSKERVDDIEFEDNIVNICSVAKIMKTKGYDRLARIHNRLLMDGYKEHIYILGVGEEQAKIEKYLRENGIEDTFTFLGYRDNPYKYVANCDLYVCSSRREGFSTAVTEALIVGTPVISTDCSGAKEMLGEHNEYGIVVKNNEDDLYNGLKKLLQNPKMLFDYKEKAITRGRFFDKKRTVEAVENMLGNLLEEKEINS